MLLHTAMMAHRLEVEMPFVDADAQTMPSRLQIENSCATNHNDFSW